MPITKITIENFKGIADRVEIPIRPITLLFGANSAGKSTILQALLYLRDLLERQNADADYLLAGGVSLNLGGFREFVHKRDTNRKIRIGVTLTLDDDGLPETRHRFNPSGPEYGLTSPEIDSVREVAVTVEVSWSDAHQRPFVTAYEVELDGTLFAAIHAQPGFEAALDFINPEHPVFYGPGEEETPEPNDLMSALDAIYRDHNGALNHSHLQGDIRERQRLQMGRSVIPDFALGLPEAWAYPPETDGESMRCAAWIFAVLNRTVVGAGKLLLEELSKIRYLGPIRMIPERNFQPRRSPSADRWADGSAAWDLLGTSDTSTPWLQPAAIASLGLGIGVECQEHFEVPRLSTLGGAIEGALLGIGEEMFDLDAIPASDFNLIRRKSRVRLVSEATGLELLPGEVGVGISQVLPVAFGAMAPGYSLFVVEQPELHIHPAVQCNLGDLLAHQVLSDQGRTLLLETHSEHLVLRMLRRIRENTEGDLPPNAPALEPKHLSVLWVEQEAGEVRIKPIPVNAQGDFDEQWPKGFFEERFDEYE